MINDKNVACLMIDSLSIVPIDSLLTKLLIVKGQAGMLVLLILFLLISSSRILAVNYPDLILYNGKIITVDSNFSIAGAVAITDEYFSDVGTNNDILKLAGPQTRKIDLHGKTVLPGLIDAHAHPEMAAVSELFEEIPDVHSINELLEYIRSQTKIKKPGEWIIHQKFFPTRLKETRQPSKEELDGAAPEKPVFLNGT
ncbi:MAG: amidohydrolase family protein, partial [Patescibacteria group bacterium]|nr:amidohydrolase family protein [Patescibacteria group bacterium]